MYLKLNSDVECITDRKAVVMLLLWKLVTCPHVSGFSSFEFSHNTQSWWHWHLIQMHQKYSRKEKEVIFSQNPNKNIYTSCLGEMISFLYNIRIFRKITSFSFFKYFDAFELDVNVVNFVYNGKTRLYTSIFQFDQAMISCPALPQIDLCFS